MSTQKINQLGALLPDQPCRCGLRGPSAESKSHTIAYIPYNRLQRYNQYTLPYRETSNAWNTHLRSWWSCSQIRVASTLLPRIGTPSLSSHVFQWKQCDGPVLSANSWDDLRYSRTNDDKWFVCVWHQLWVAFKMPLKPTTNAMIAQFSSLEWYAIPLTATNFDPQVWSRTLMIFQFERGSSPRDWWDCCFPMIWLLYCPAPLVIFG